MKNIFNKLLVFTVVLGGLLATGCEDEQVGQADRLFRPVISEDATGGTWIKLKWNRYEGANEFELELSVDSFTTILQTVVTEATQYTFEDLEYDTKYNIRIRSLGNNIASEKFVYKDLTTQDFPTKLITPTADDIVDVAVRVKWNVGDASYDSLSVFKKDTLIRTTLISPQEYQLGEKIITGLSSSTSYTVKAYVGDEYKGKKAFKTAASQNFEGTVVDLRNFSEEEAYTLITQSFVDSIDAGSTVVMNGGTTYLMPTLILSKDVTFVTGLSLSGKARFAVDGNFAISDVFETPPTVILKDLFFTDSESKPKTASNYGGTYLFNLNKAGSAAKEIRITGCEVKYKRGFFRTQTRSVVEKLVIENTVCDSIGGYGVVNVDNAEAEITEMVVRKSTFSHCDAFIVNSKGLSGQSVVVENVTTFQTPAKDKYFFDFNGRVTPQILISKSLFGVAKNGDPAKGLRSKSPALTVSGNYGTNDLKWSVNADTQLPIDPMDIDIYNKSSYELFTNPDNLDLTITVKDFPNVGDPRWK